MSRKLICFLAFLLVGVAYIPTAHADEATGYLFFDAATGSHVGSFNVVNQTGVNSSGDSTWPVDTQLAFAVSLPGTVFTLGADGFSWDGSATDQTGKTSATLTGTLSPTLLTLFDSSTVMVNSSFSATLTDPSGISGGDSVVIYATTGGGVRTT